STTTNKPQHKKQNQSQNGTTATTTNTQEAERCETRISQPSYTPSKESAQHKQRNKKQQIT
ncbi:hypothetical protein, partial [Gardnerella vaginalis]|uniref:hypothetical protein n=1 Tax=Gardnerella vaginalis TaxID=2702 RepID=UPI001C71CDB0